MSDLVSTEARLYGAFAALLDSARKLRSEFRNAGIPCPPSLLRVVGEEPARAESRKPTTAEPAKKTPPTPTKVMAPSARASRRVASRQGRLITAPPGVEHPVDVPEDWIPVPISAASPETMVLSVLREAKRPLTRDIIATAVNVKGRETSEGTISNVGTLLVEKEIIERSGDGWMLRDPARAPVLGGKYIWGAKEQFTMYEVAAWRREAVLHVLRANPAGLTRKELVRTMDACPWFKARPSSVEGYKSDLDWLVHNKKVHLLGKRWTVLPSGEGAAP